MRILGLESSCDETAAAVVEDGRTLLSSVVALQIEIHKLYGGVVPEIASRAHTEAICGVTRSALEKASLSMADVDAIAVTVEPGLIGALLTGLSFAKGTGLRNRQAAGARAPHPRAHRRKLSCSPAIGAAIHCAGRLGRRHITHSGGRLYRFQAYRRDAGRRGRRSL